VVFTTIVFPLGEAITLFLAPQWQTWRSAPVPSIAIFFLFNGFGQRIFISRSAAKSLSRSSKKRPGLIWWTAVGSVSGFVSSSPMGVSDCLFNPRLHFRIFYGLPGVKDSIFRSAIGLRWSIPPGTLFFALF